MSKPEKLLYHTLDLYHVLGSPQVNSFNPLDESSISIFSFHFKGLDKEDNIYFKLIRLIENFSGDLSWIMHGYGSRKNYTIEPLEIYFLKRKHGVEYINFLSKEDCQKIVDSSQRDTIKLCEYIKKNFP